MTPGVVSFFPGRDMSFDPRLLVFEFLCNIMLRKSQACWACVVSRSMMRVCVLAVVFLGGFCGRWKPSNDVLVLSVSIFGRGDI